MANLPCSIAVQMLNRPHIAAGKEEGRAMAGMTRRSLINSSVGLAAATSFGRPYVANAQAKTATVWWIQGFAHEEDVAFKKLVDDYQKASSNKIDYSIIPYAPMRQKIVSAITSGVVPDLFQNSPTETNALYAWDDKLIDVSDVIETQKNEYTQAALASAHSYNNATKKRSYYLVPYTTSALPNHVWGSLVKKAGYEMEDIPKTWDAFYNFFKDVQKKLREKGQRRVYGLGFQVTTNGNDPNNVFNYFLCAYGGRNFVDKNGVLHVDDPQVKEAIIKALEFPARAYKEGFVPPSAINWNDADDNNAFHAKTIVMDLDGTISTEVAIIKKKDEYDDIVTMGLALGNDGKPIPAVVTNTGGMIPKGAKNVDVAKDFLKYLIQPKVLNEYLKTGLGRNLPAMTSIVKNDPWWTEDPHRKAYVEEGLLGDTVSEFFVFNPAYAQCRNEHVFPTGWADVILHGMSPQEAAEKAIARAKEIFANYKIG
jgi:multiple sugar transport system substrate-binding protein